MKIISLGWGVQSFTMAAMVALGELEPVDFAIHSDTLHERSDTYAFVAKWKPWLEDHGVRVVIVKNPTGGVFKILDKPGQTHVPFFTLSENGEQGQLNRSCTHRWKIVPMRRWISAELGRRGLTKSPGVVEQWLGISLDEFQRMKDSDVKYITHRWPLIEKRMTRHDCQLWLESHGLEIPPKSACVFCPYHNQAAWRELKMSGNGDWETAVSVDKAFRNVRKLARIPVDVFVHPARIPLEEVDVRNEEDRGQLSLWDNECSGVCGL